MGCKSSKFSTTQNKPLGPKNQENLKASDNEKGKKTPEFKSVQKVCKKSSSTSEKQIQEFCCEGQNKSECSVKNSVFIEERQLNLSHQSSASDAFKQNVMSRIEERQKNPVTMMDIKQKLLNISDDQKMILEEDPAHIEQYMQNNPQSGLVEITVDMGYCKDEEHHGLQQFEVQYLNNFKKKMDQIHLSLLKKWKQSQMDTDMQIEQLIKKKMQSQRQQFEAEYLRNFEKRMSQQIEDAIEEKKKGKSQ